MVAVLQRRARITEALAVILMIVLLAELAVMVAAVLRDYATAIGSPLELDYGEGIVWQQAALIPGPRMYSTSQALPFIVFHYPPLYYLVCRVFLPFFPSFLAAGRFVSVMSSFLVAGMTSTLVVIASRKPGLRLNWLQFAIAFATGLLVLCLHVVHAWGMVMRVDALAVAFSTAGLLVGALSKGRFPGTLFGLLLCLASVYTKQTQLAAGIALFIWSLGRAPRPALAASCITGAVGLGVLLWLEKITHGGFLQNIVGYNINRFSTIYFLISIWSERSSMAVIVLTLLAAAAMAVKSMPSRACFRSGIAWRNFLASHFVDEACACRTLLLIYFVLSSLSLASLFKSGGSYNYLFGWLCGGCALLGILLCRFAANVADGRFQIWMAALVFAAFQLHNRSGLDNSDRLSLDENRALVAHIAAADKPVASDNMALLMEAGKPVVFEPAIVSELAAMGRWDETPLIDMIRSHKFAFFVTEGKRELGVYRRTPAQVAAINEAYPRVEQVGQKMWLRLPPN